MILRMKNFEYFWGSLKNPTFREGGHKKPEGGAWTVCQFKRRAWQERGGGVLERGLVPQCTL